MHTLFGKRKAERVRERRSKRESVRVCVVCQLVTHLHTYMQTDDFRVRYKKQLLFFSRALASMLFVRLAVISSVTKVSSIK